MDATATEQETLEDRVKRIKVKGILENPAHARTLVQEIVRYGDSVTLDKFITHVIYRILDVPRDEKNLPFYRTDLVSIDGAELGTKVVFMERFPNLDYKKLDDIGDDLIRWGFGERVIDFFHYAQKKLNSTGFQRVGGEDLNDSYIFVHSVRILAGAKTTYEKQLALLHDLFEELRKYRKGELRKREEEKNGAVETAIRVGLSQDDVNRLGKDYDERIKTYGEFIETSPEREDVRKLFERHFAAEHRDERKGQVLAEVALTHLDLLSRKDDEAYDTYSRRLVTGVDSVEIRQKLKSIGIEGLEAMAFYMAPLKVKLLDSYDNTERSREVDILKNYKRLEHNLIIINSIDIFLRKYDIRRGEVVDERNNLLKVSKTELNFNLGTKYKGDSNPHILAYLRSLNSLKLEYDKLQPIRAFSLAGFRESMSLF